MDIKGDDKYSNDLSRFEILKKLNVLVSLKNTLVPVSNEEVVVLVLCGDGRKFFDKHGYFCKMHDTSHTHVISGAGHALYVAPPTKGLFKFNPAKHIVVVKDVLYGAAKFCTNKVALIVHAPCAVADENLVSLNLYDIVERAVNGKDFLEKIRLTGEKERCTKEYNRKYQAFDLDIKRLRSKDVKKLNVSIFLHFMLQNGKRSYETYSIDPVAWVQKRELAFTMYAGLSEQQYTAVHA